MKETVIDVLMYMLETYMDDYKTLELDQDVLHASLSDAGFESRDIKKAFDWLEGLPNMNMRTKINSPCKNTYRYYLPKENSKLGDKGKSFIMFLEQLKILDAESREHVIDRIMALDSVEISIEQLKWVVLMVLFNMPGKEEKFYLLEELVFEKSFERVH